MSLIARIVQWFRSWREKRHDWAEGSYIASIQSLAPNSVDDVDRVERFCRRNGWTK